VKPGLSKVGVVRKLAAIVLAGAFLVTLGACSDLPAEVQGCVPNATSGAASQAFAAATTGAFGSPDVTNAPTPTRVTHAETTVEHKGTGLLLGPEDEALTQISVFLGSTGAILQSTADSTTRKFTGAGALIPVGVKTVPIGRYLSCERVGSRSVTVLTAKEYFGTAAAATSASVSPTASLVIVTDITHGYRGRATGVLQPAQPDFPSVVTSGNGTPGLTFDLQTPPKKLAVEVVRRGSGAKLKADDPVLLQVQGVEWTNPAATTTFDSTWTSGSSPRFYPLKALSPNGDASTGAAVYSLDPGSVKALVGQTIGSQILVVVPPKFGYPSGKAPSGYPTGTLVFVYDILGVLPTS
jgi:hypothetical protein